MKLIGSEASLQAHKEDVLEKVRRGNEVMVWEAKMVLRDGLPHGSEEYMALVALRRNQRQARREELIYTVQSRLLDRERRGLSLRTIIRLEGEHRNLQAAIKRATPEPYRVRR